MLERLFVVFLVLVFTTRSVRSEITTELETFEGTEVNSTIGSLRDSLQSSPDKIPEFLCNAALFSVDSRTGDVKVKQDLDREVLCQKHRQCCGVVDCTISMNVVVIDARSKAYLTSLKLVVKVNDINDNQPSFSSAVQRVSIPENSEVGKLIGLRPAIDSDVDPRNQITRYQWSEPTGTFSLDQSNLPAIRLRLNGPIDRELRANYSGVLSACDIDYCASIEVLIEIEDVNDNSPTFPKRRYRLTALESFPPGSTILKLNASDADSGENARIFYSFHEPVDPDLVDTFEIVANTGEIRLRRPLDAKIRGYYNFKVVACDTVASECTGNPASNVEVQIDVEDVNDNRPFIEIVPSGGMRTSSDDLVVQENSPPGQIAVVRVKDADIGENARTSCDLDGQSAFELTHSAQDLYSLRTTRSFDYEQETHVTTTIRCHDYGIPQLNSTRTINLRVLDVNEYPPEFPMRVYSASIMENSPPGVEIISLAATDRDGQAELRYSLAPPPLQEGGNKDVNKHFDLDPKTGVLRTSRDQLDREAIERITLIVLVTDALTQPIFTSTATVSIEVLDENDNSPVFFNPPANMQSGDLAHAFTVRENSPKYTRLSGRLEARDPDAGENGRLLFYIRSVWALKTPASQRGISFGGNMIDNSAPGRQLIDPVKIFQITPDGGIETLVEFDREQVAMYLLSVGVRDNGSKPYSTYASVLVQILDENDNSPVWSFPTETARQINITTANPPGSLVARLQAHDADADGAGRVEFQILDSNGQSMPPVSISRGLYNAPPPQPSSQSKHPSPIPQEELMGYRVGPFYLNGSTGELLVADRLVPLNLKIRLRAIDCGDAQRLFTDTWMIINVKMDPNEFGGFLGGGRAGALNVTIILVMIAVTAIISLLLIIAIVCVRRKPSRTVMGNGTAVVESEGRMVAYSPGSPFMIPDPNKETLSANTWNGSSKDFYPPGSLTIDEKGQVVSTGGMAYGSPILGSDKTSIFCGGVSQQYTSLEANGDIISGSLPMHTFGTMSRNPRQPAVLGSIHGSTTGMRMAGSLQYDADSGDSGRGPSEDGNQLMMMDNQRMFSPHPGHAYGTCSGYRSASRMSYGPRSASAMGNPSNGCIVNPNNGMMNASSRTFIHDPHNNGDPCSCYVEEGQQQGHLQQPQSPPYGEYIDTPGSPFLAQRSPLGGYRTFHFSPSPQRFTPGAGESTISASIGSLPRSRAPSRSTVTFQSPSLVHQQPQQQPIKLDLRGPVELDNSEATFPGLPPRPTIRTVSNPDDSEDIVD